MDYVGSERRTCYGVVLLWVCSIDRSVGAASELDANKVILVEIMTILTVFLAEIEFFNLMEIFKFMFLLL